MKNEQINEILKRENITASDFSQKTGIQRSAVSHLQNNRNKVSLDVVNRIHTAFPHISLYWLLDGTGDYYVEDKEKNIIPSQSQEIPSSKTPEKTVEISQSERVSSVVKPIETLSSGVSSLSKTEELVPVLGDKTDNKKGTERKVVEIKVFYDDGTYENYLKE